MEIVLKMLFYQILLDFNFTFDLGYTRMIQWAIVDTFVANSLRKNTCLFKAFVEPFIANFGIRLALC